jgi:putative ABC transport system permease protein
VLLADGAVVGAVAAMVGTAAGLVLWIAVAPPFETAAAHRIDRFNLPWWQLAAAMLLTVVTATAAAWRPARTAARIPVALALSARPPLTRPAHRSGLAAALLLGAGLGCLWLTGRTNPLLGKALEIRELLLIVAGIVTIGAGLLFLAPLAIQALAAAGARLPVAARLALRDLARHQARSGAALAAISLALAIPTSTVVLATAAGRQSAAEGNLSDRQLLIRIDAPGSVLPDRTPAQLGAIETQLRRYTARLGSPTVIPLDLVGDPAEEPRAGADGGPIGRAPVGLAVPAGPRSFRGAGPSYVATPDLLRHYKVDSGGIDQDTDVLTTQPRRELRFVSASSATKRDFPRATTAPLRGPGYTSLPTVLVTPAALQRHGWAPARAGWLVEADRPLTAEQLAGAHDLAVEAGLTVESRNTHAGLLVLRWVATAAGAVLALAVLAMTIGLIRAEAAADLRTLTATGATGRIRRTLTATTAGGLALLGAVLGIAVAYASLAASAGRHVGVLAEVPVLELAATAAGVPLLAAAAGWILTAREPRSLTRTRLE